VMWRAPCWGNDFGVSNQVKLPEMRRRAPETGLDGFRLLPMHYLWGESGLDFRIGKPPTHWIGGSILVAGARNQRFLRLVERHIPRLTA
jgi:hypothetical protein